MKITKKILIILLMHILVAANTGAERLCLPFSTYGYTLRPLAQQNLACKDKRFMIMPSCKNGPFEINGIICYVEQVVEPDEIHKALDEWFSASIERFYERGRWNSAFRKDIPNVFFKQG